MSRANPAPRIGWQCWGAAENYKTHIGLSLEEKLQSGPSLLTWREVAGGHPPWGKATRCFMTGRKLKTTNCQGTCGVNPLDFLRFSTSSFSFGLPPPSPSRPPPMPLSGMTTFFCYENPRAWLPRELAIENAVLVLLGFFLFVNCLLSNQITG